MDADENDLLFTNSFIPVPELDTEILSEHSSEFRKYYEREKSLNEERRLRDSIDRMSIRSVHLTEETDENNLLNSNLFTKMQNAPPIQNVSQKTTQIQDVLKRNK